MGNCREDQGEGKGIWEGGLVPTAVTCAMNVSPKLHLRMPPFSPQTYDNRKVATTTEREPLAACRSMRRYIFAYFWFAFRSTLTTACSVLFLVWFHAMAWQGRIRLYIIFGSLGITTREAITSLRSTIIITLFINIVQLTSSGASFTIKKIS